MIHTEHKPPQSQSEECELRPSLHIIGPDDQPFEQEDVVGLAARSVRSYSFESAGAKPLERGDWEGVNELLAKLEVQPLDSSVSDDAIAASLAKLMELEKEYIAAGRDVYGVYANAVSKIRNIQKRR